MTRKHNLLQNGLSRLYQITNICTKKGVLYIFHEIVLSGFFIQFVLIDAKPKSARILVLFRQIVLIGGFLNQRSHSKFPLNQKFSNDPILKILKKIARRSNPVKCSNSYNTDYKHLGPWKKKSLYDHNFSKFVKSYKNSLVWCKFLRSLSNFRRIYWRRYSFDHGFQHIITQNNFTKNNYDFIYTALTL